MNKCGFRLGALMIMLLSYGCSSKPSEKEIEGAIKSSLVCCGLEEDDTKVKISGISKDSDNLAIVLAEISTSKPVEIVNQLSVASPRSYKFHFRKYDKGWLIENKEPLGELAPMTVDIYEFISVLSANCQAFNMGRAKGALSAMRAAIRVYYGDHKGSFPTDLRKDLIPKYFTDVPALIIGDHPKTNSVKFIPKWDGECSGITNSGGWIYGNDPNNAISWGNLGIDSDELSPEGKKWCMY